MNYLAHGCVYLDRPYFVAGTAVPDWLNVVDRKVRARRRGAEPLVDDPDPRVAELARGIVQHHHDDDWFHRTRAFAELSWGLTVRVRDALRDQAGLRPSFLGHVLVELLLDSWLIQTRPGVAQQYYESLAAVDEQVVQRTVNRIAARSTTQLALWIPRFCESRFLLDYTRDDKLVFRLNQVMRRVGLSPLPESFRELLPEARRAVAGRSRELLTPP